MAEGSDVGRTLRVLRNSREATQYQILVEIAERQPAVVQSEIADALGITAQAVSDHLRELSENQLVEKLGRGRYEITTQGVDWLISRTEELQAFTRYVSEDLIEQVDVEAAIATDRIETGDRVSLSMDNGILHASPGTSGPSTAEAVTDAEPNRDVGVAEFRGLLEFELGRVTITVVPTIRNGGSAAIDVDALADRAVDADVIAVAGIEAIAALNAAGIEPDVAFGTPSAVQEAALKGLDVTLVVARDQLSGHTDRLREHDIDYEVIEPE